MYDTTGKSKSGQQGTGTAHGTFGAYDVQVGPPDLQGDTLVSAAGTHCGEGCRIIDASSSDRYK